MHVVVVGCGRVGSELAGTLEKQGHTVAVIDKRKDAFRRLPTGFGGYRIVGFGFDRDTLTEAGVQDAGALAAVTSGDNSNIMSARVARETFQVERVVEPNLVGQEGDVLHLLVDPGALDALQARLNGADEALHA